MKATSTTPWIAAPLRVCGDFFRWVRQTLDMLCDRPDHLQRLAIIGAGMSLFPMVAVMVWIVWKGFPVDPNLMPQQLSILGNALYGFIGLFAIAIIALLGIVRGIRVSGPGGVNVEIETTAGDGDGPSLSQQTTVIQNDHRHGWGRRDRDPEPQPQAGTGAGQITE